MADDLKWLDTWNDAMTSLQLLQIDPSGFGGVWLKAPFGPVRTQWLAHLTQTGVNTVNLPGHVDRDRLLGGIDLSTTLQTGHLHMQAGLLAQADKGLVCISMAERFPAALIAPMTQAMDTRSLPPLHSADHAATTMGTSFGVVALDESTDDEPPLSDALQDRLGIWLDLRELAPADIVGRDLFASPASSDQRWAPILPDMGLDADSLRNIQHALPRVQASDAQITALCAAAQALGIDSLRIPSLALRVACCHAALHGRVALDDTDVAFAARCVLAPRATRSPAAESNAESNAEANSEPTEEATAPEAQTPPSQDAPASDAADQDPQADQADQADPQSPSPADLQELVVAAALASLPNDVLDRLLTQAGRNQGHTSGRSGQAKAGVQRGRPLPPRPGPPGGHARLHVLATLRAAAPKQRLRAGAQPGRVAIRAEDFHVHRYQQRSASCLIFALDASGSAALNRLAEAKGAVERLLQASYARRDSVCIVAFRGARADLLLPMTRSLVRAKRAMTGLPGGGGTPLASALQLSVSQAMQLQRQGVTPLLVVLSDGRANVDLAGRGGRSQALLDTQTWCAQWRLNGHRSLWIDTSAQPDAQVRSLADAMGAGYLPMPQAQAERIASAMDNLRRGDA